MQWGCPSPPTPGLACLPGQTLAAPPTEEPEKEEEEELEEEEEQEEPPAGLQPRGQPARRTHWAPGLPESLLFSYLQFTR